MKIYSIVLFVFCISIQLWFGYGAKYSGKSMKDINDLLDDSDDTLVFALNDKAHPRGHVEGPDGVEKYSRTKRGPVTAFKNKNDQNNVLERIMTLGLATPAMNDLNYYAKNIYPNKRSTDIPIECRKKTLYFTNEQLGYKNGDADIPEIRGYSYGKPDGGNYQKMIGAALQLAHKNSDIVNKVDIDNAEVVIYTFFGTTTPFPVGKDCPKN